MESQKNGLIAIDDRQEGMQLAIILHALQQGNIDDICIIETLISTKGTPTSIDALIQLIAAASKESGVVKADLIRPILDLLRRNMRGIATSQEPKPPEKDSLAEMQINLAKAKNTAEKLIGGIMLGDRATHMHAGMIGSRNLTRIMGRKGLANYTEGMARRGYETALEAAERSDITVARTTKAMIGPIIQEFQKAVMILAALLRTRRKILSTASISIH